MKDGADEIDMVIAIGAVKESDREYVTEDIMKVREAIDMAASSVRQNDRPVLKVILETCLLTDDELYDACRWAIDAGADYLKTSTGFAGGGAKIEHIQIMKKAIEDHHTEKGDGAEVGREIKIKASGGIRNLETALSMIDAGASRIGASATAAILS